MAFAEDALLEEDTFRFVMGVLRTIVGWEVMRRKSWVATVAIAVKVPQ